jgi:hypothetical protein
MATPITTLGRDSETARPDFLAPKSHQPAASSNGAMPSRLAASVGLAALLALSAPPASAADEDDAVAADTLVFRMVRASGAEDAGCLEGARADVTIGSFGPVEHMSVVARGLPPETEFDLFVIQLPDAPFGLSWYQGDLETDARGRAAGVFLGRFNVETFIVAPGSGEAPVVHDTDADTNPATDPVHTFHLGLWFDAPEDAAAAGCPDAVTPFNGEHDAGIQALSTRNFPPAEGPLGRLGG